MDNVISSEAVTEYLDAIREACGDSQIVDVHVHATEVIKGRARYETFVDGIYGAADVSAYKAPSIAAIRLEAGDVNIAGSRQNRLSELTFSMAYRFTGPTVLGDQLDIAKVDKAALLPVSSAACSITEQMDIIDACCVRDKRFLRGYCIPFDLAPDEVAEHLDDVLGRYDIRILKVHPNITSIDVASERGREHINGILRACDVRRIPILLHGGCSPILGDKPERRFGAIENLAKIDWSMTSAPVIIAHFGVYGCMGPSAPASSQSIELLVGMLDQHSNLYTDTSGVSYEAIRLMLSRIGTDRVVFGSDALYVPIYRQLVLVAHALRDLGVDFAEIRKVACENPARIFGRHLPAK